MKEWKGLDDLVNKIKRELRYTPEAIGTEIAPEALIRIDEAMKELYKKVEELDNRLTKIEDRFLGFVHP